MNGIVLELQREALLPETKVTDLLRKTYVVAKKLQLKELESWTSCEMKGYRSSSERKKLPEYRTIHGILKAFNPYQGWIPVILNDEYAKLICNQPVYQSVSELEDLVKKNDGGLALRLSDFIITELCRITDFEADFQLKISSSSIVAIIENVKGVILEWTLKLEENGIYGESMTFTKEEKERASLPQIQHFTNNFFGKVSTPQLQQGTSDSTQD